MQSITLTEGWEHYRGGLGGIWEVWRADKLPNSFFHVPWERVSLPHCFNSHDGADPDVKYYQGAGWYRTRLHINNPYPGGRTLLHFEGVGQKSAVFIHTEEVARHNGGYDEFTVDITEAAERIRQHPLYGDEIPLAVLADNSRDLQTVPSDISDFNLYGGIYRKVQLVYVPALSLERVHVEVRTEAKNGSGGAADNTSGQGTGGAGPEEAAGVLTGQAGYRAQVSVRARLYNPASAAGEARLTAVIRDPAGAEVRRFEKLCFLPQDGAVELASFGLEEPVLWSPDQPSLYTCEVTLTCESGETGVAERFGVRHFEFVKKGPFLLNGQRLLLNGTQRHEDHAGVGAAMTDEMICAEMKLVKEMGANFIRLGHYQQSRLVLDLCDELGLLVWEEIPWCRGGLGNEAYKAQCRDMLRAMIDQHYNHPSVIIWGLGNENDWEGDYDYFDKEAIRSFMKELHELSHRLDGSRVTAIRRCEFCKDIVDVYSPSIWAGWYRGIYTQYETYTRNEFEQTDRFFHMEWGADNMAGRHVEKPYTGFAEIASGATAEERDGDFLMSGGDPRVSVLGDWSETYFCDLIDWHLKCQETMDWLAGTAQWVFKDFSTPVRPENPVPYVNQKGVVERDLTKKEAFYVFQSYWSKEPMVRIYGHSWKVRWGKAGEKKRIRVYSNCRFVELFVNGESQGVKERNSQDFPCAGLRWDVVLPEGANELKAVGWNSKEEAGIVEDWVQLRYQTAVWSAPAQLRLTARRVEADRVLLEAEAYDSNGNYCADASCFVRFSAAGDGRLLDNLGTAQGSRLVQLANGRAAIYAEVKPGAGFVAAVSSEGLPAAHVIVV
ncbi:MAG: glycoside hydrolase family 2 protein [Paenibacillaceae bacterium]|jgi:beta-galactosidase|nr:glycoside hydrolase family 2 protein [Paenibacillaceae bacterium]